MIEPLLPMLAVRGQPFDSPEFLFEVKWNGVRALAARDQGGWRLWGRDRADYGGRYPELAVLGRLPAGTVVDGELVLLADGLPDLGALLARHQLTRPDQVRHTSARQPVTYVLFDVLSCQGHSLLGQPLRARREVLPQLLDRLQEPRLLLSAGVVGPGRLWFEKAVAQGQEGVMAKHLASRYLPGRRSAAWRKIKPVRSLPCVIVGFVPGRDGCRRLLVAAARDGPLRYVATLHAGGRAAAGADWSAVLATRVRPRPVVPCPGRGVWVEPDLFCQVRFLEWTRAGRLRGASFQGLLGPSPAVPRPPGG
jgi:ATP-dependent DNA ligase